jgi:hypothetical protein
MRTIVSASALFLSLAASPALAQLAPGLGTGPLGGGDMIGGGAPTPALQRPQDIAPAGVPGAVTTPLATGPSLQKNIGDPTTALFNAIDKNDYGAAQNAVGRGANLNAQNPLGETPLDMSVALNRSTITFMLLAARNEEGDSSGATQAPGSTYSAPAPARAPTVTVSDHTTAPRPQPVPVMGNDPGTPDPAAGFLGFNPAK